MANFMVDFLIDRKYPLAKSLRAPGLTVRGIAPSFRAQTLEEAGQYRAELERMPKDELNALFQRERQKQADESASAAQREEEARFFNQASAVADYPYWCKAAYWSLDEAVALALGKNPELVNPSRLALYRSISPFVERFDRLKNLAVRAKGVGKLFDPVYPSIFVYWALENEIDIPDMMRDLVMKGASRVEWEAVSKNQSELIETLNELIAVEQSRIANFEETVAFLRKRLDAAERAEPSSETERLQAAPVNEPKPQSPVERENMLKMILAAAMDCYGHDPVKARSTATADFRSALNKIGLDLSDDTIRRFIKAAEDQLPEWREKAS